jgi:hypothetical protein
VANPIMADDFIRTIDSDFEDLQEDESPSLISKNKGKRRENDTDTLNPEFVFDLTGSSYQEILAGGTPLNDIVNTGSKPVCIVIFHPLHHT